MANWKKMESNLLNRLSRMIKREDWFVHTSRPEYSIRIKHQLTSDILHVMVPLSDNLHSITVYQNGNQIEEYNKLPEHSLSHMLNLIGNRLVDKDA